MSKNIGNAKDFLKFITNPLTLNAIDLIYKNHNVVYERVDLYRNFTFGLNRLIQDTYLGDDISNDVVKKQHFDWCWIKSCSLLEVQGIFLLDNQELYEYFRIFFVKTFYSVEDKENSKKLQNIEPVFSYILDYNQVKQSSDIDTFIEIYRKFELSFKNK